MIIGKTKSTKDHLCKYCQKDIATCAPYRNVKYGNGRGNDNVIQCSCFIVRRFNNTYPITTELRE